MPASLQWVFGPFRLDQNHACLWYEAQAIPLPPKVFAVLHYLVTHPNRLVTKDELLDAVWPETAVSDAVVRVAIGALRRIWAIPLRRRALLLPCGGAGIAFWRRWRIPMEYRAPPGCRRPWPCSRPREGCRVCQPPRCRTHWLRPPVWKWRSLQAFCRPRKQNAAPSRYCFVTWSTRPRWQVAWTWKTSGRWCKPTTRPVPRWFSALTAIWPNTLGMGCWRILATSQRTPPEMEKAEAYYQQALALAEELGMRPLQAHCHRGLGTLYATRGQPEQACAALSTAIALYRAMQMTFWLPQAEAALGQVSG